MKFLVMLRLDELISLYLMGDRPCWWTWRRLMENTKPIGEVYAAPGRN